MGERARHGAAAHARARTRARRSAFTLAELLVVLGIIALASAIVLPVLIRVGMGDEQRAVRTRVIEIVRAAQVDADATGLPVAVQYKPRSRRFVVSGREYALPGGWRPTIGDPARLAPEARDAANRLAGEDSVVRVATGADPDAPVTLMTWSPGGMASPTDWSLVNAGGARVRVVGDAIDGVRVE